MASYKTIPDEQREHKRKRTGQTKPYRIAQQDADAVAILAFRYGGLNSAPEDLIDKLEDFHRDHPKLHGSMVGMLKSLDDVWRLQHAQHEWVRFIPGFPPPDRGSMVACLEASDVEIRSAIDRIAALVRRGSLKTADRTHEQFGTIIREIISGRPRVTADKQLKLSSTYNPADPPPTDSAGDTALPPETKKLVRSEGMRRPSNPAKVKRR